MPYNTINILGIMEVFWARAIIMTASLPPTSLLAMTDPVKYRLILSDCDDDSVANILLTYEYNAW